MALSGFLRQSAAATVMVGPFVDATDGDTEETGLTIAQADVRLSKNAVNMAQKNEATSCSHDEKGIYTCILNATDTNTLGLLTLAIHHTGTALLVRHDFMVFPVNVYDSLVGFYGSDYLKTDVTEIEGTDATDQLTTSIENVMGTAKVTVGDKTGFSLAINQSAVTIGTATSIQQIEGSDATDQLDARMQAVLGTAKVTVGSNADKTGYSLAADQAVNTTKINGSDATATIDARIQKVMGTAKVTVGDKTGFSLAINQSAVTIGTATSIQQIEGTDATDQLKTSIENVLGTAKVTVGASNDKTGYSLAADQAVNTTKINGSDATATIDARIQVVMGTAKITVGASNDKSGYSLAIDQSAVTIGTVNIADSINKIEGADATDTIDARIQAVMGTAKVTIGSNTDKTGYSLAADQQVDTTKIEGTDATNVLDARIQAVLGTAKITVGTSDDKTGYSLVTDQAVNTTKIEGVDATDQLDARIQAVMGTVKVTVGSSNDKTGYSLAINQGAVTIGTVNIAVGLTTNNDKTEYRLSATGVDDILDEAIAEPSSVFAWASATPRKIFGWLGALTRNKMTQTSTTSTLRNDADGADISTSTVSDDGSKLTRGEWE